MPRRMADPSFRQTQWDHRYDPHIAPINQLVDELRKDPDRGWAPYVAPIYGGVKARLLSLSRDPGPKTRDDAGSGFLCCENDDPSAERMSLFYSAAGISPLDAIAWNAYPWYINRHPTGAEIEAGLGPLRRLLLLLPLLRVVMLHGGDAQASWKRFSRMYPSIAIRYRAVPTYHTSRQALWTKDPNERARRESQLRDAFHSAALALAPKQLA